MIGVLWLPITWGGATVVAPGAPTITNRSPASGVVGTVVTLTGTNLSAATQVQLGVVSCVFTVVSATTVTAVVPTGATTGSFSITTPDGTATSDTFTVTPPVLVPTITSFTPASGNVGAVVTLTGTNFTGVTSVTLGAVACTFTVLSPTSISVTVPSGAVDGVFTVTSSAGSATSATPFDVTFALPASQFTLRWMLEVYPSAQTSGRTRTLLKTSRNAIVVRDIVDVESDTYQTPSAVTWALREGADIAAEGPMTLMNDYWRAEIVLDPDIAVGSGPVLRVTATLGGATWVRDYPITISDQE